MSREIQESTRRLENRLLSINFESGTKQSILSSRTHDYEYKIIHYSPPDSSGMQYVISEEIGGGAITESREEEKDIQVKSDASKEERVSESKEITENTKEKKTVGISFKWIFMLMLVIVLLLIIRRL